MCLVNVMLSWITSLSGVCWSVNFLKSNKEHDRATHRAWLRLLSYDWTTAVHGWGLANDHLITFNRY